MTLLRTLVSGLSFLGLVASVAWLVYSNSTLTPLRLAGLWGGKGVPNPFTRSPTDPLLLPLGLWLLFFAILGLLLGLYLGWFIGGQTRVRARQQGRRARQAEQALAQSRKESDVAKLEADDLKIANKELEAQVQRAAPS